MKPTEIYAEICGCLSILNDVSELAFVDDDKIDVLLRESVIRHLLGTVEERLQRIIDERWKEVARANDEISAGNQKEAALSDNG